MGIFFLIGSNKYLLVNGPSVPILNLHTFGVQLILSIIPREEGQC